MELTRTKSSDWSTLLERKYALKFEMNRCCSCCLWQVGKLPVPSHPIPSHLVPFRLVRVRARRRAHSKSAARTHLLWSSVRRSSRSSTSSASLSGVTHDASSSMLDSRSRCALHRARHDRSSRSEASHDAARWSSSAVWRRLNKGTVGLRRDVAHDQKKRFLPRVLTLSKGLPP